MISTAICSRSVRHGMMGDKDWRRTQTRINAALHKAGEQGTRKSTAGEDARSLSKFCFFVPAAEKVMCSHKGRPFKQSLKGADTHDSLLAVHKASSEGAQTPCHDAKGHPVTWTEVLHGKIVGDLANDIAAPEDLDNVSLNLLCRGR